eukprot:365300-Chlamydomonas_euryale.AAC.9
MSNHVYCKHGCLYMHARTNGPILAWTNTSTDRWIAAGTTASQTAARGKARMLTGLHQLFEAPAVRSTRGLKN